MLPLFVAHSDRGNGKQLYMNLKHLEPIGWFTEQFQSRTIFLEETKNISREMTTLSNPTEKFSGMQRVAIIDSCYVLRFHG